MPNSIKIKKGLDINLKGRAELSIQSIDPKLFAIKPTDFFGVTPKLHVQEGDTVKAGDVLFHSKQNEAILFTSPVSGIVKEIRRGPKRLLEAVILESDQKYDSIDFEIGSLDRQQIKKSLLESGLWPMIRQRPFSVIANPEDEPKAFFISCFDSAPLAPDLDFVISNFPESFKKGLQVLEILSGNKLHLSVHDEKTHSDIFLKATGATLHLFSGPHPSGNIGTQINKISPINKGESIWYCHPQDVAVIGRFFLTGKYDSTKIFAIAGSQLVHPCYVKTRIGAQINALTEQNLKPHQSRFISGNVLTGTKIDSDGFISFYHNQISVIPEGNYFEMFGWIWPGFSKFSFSKAFPTSFIPKFIEKKYDIDTNTHGEERPFVVTGEFEKVFPFDIYPLQLIKACIIQDIELMENLGIYEVDEEDFALCEFIDPSKTNIQEIIRNALMLLKKETE